MADTTIRFKLSSIFAGEGFAAANTAVKTTAGGAAQLTGTLRSVGTAAGALGGEAGKLAGTLGGVVGGFRSLGIAGGTIGALMTGISLAVDKVREKYENMAKAAKESCDALITKNKALATAITDGLHAALDKVGKQADADAKSLDNMTAAVNRVNAAVGRNASAKEEASVVQLKLDNLNKVLAAENDNAAALAKAEGELAVAVLERTNALAAHTRAVDTAQKAEDDAAARVDRARQNLDGATQALAKAREDAAFLEVAASNDYETAGKMYEDSLKAVTEAENLLKRRQDELTAAVGAATEAQLNTETETVKLNSAETSYAARVKEAESALSDLKESQAESARQEAINDEIKANAAKQEQTLADAAAKKAAIRADFEQRRQSAMDRLANAEVAAAQWEERKAELDQQNYTDIQKRQLDNLSRIYEQNKYAVSDKQRQEVEVYREWLAHQDANPEKIVVESLKTELSMLDQEMKQDLSTVEENTRESVDELKQIAKDLKASLTLH